tara:strand:+ start:11106 stop:12266 length:1161 start_codon:yes stop_codon:yes gene_type:complete
MKQYDRIPDHVLADIYARTDLVDLVERSGVKLVKSGREYAGLCPFHSERTPSFTVRPDKGFTHCFGCGAHKDAIGYYTTIYNVSFIEGVRALAYDAGVDITEYVGRAEKPASPPKPTIASKQTEQDRTSETDKKRKRGYKIWQAGVALAGSVGERYLAEKRGINPELFLNNGVHRLHPDLGYWAVRMGRKKPELIWSGPALLSVMRYIDGRFAACHVTWIDLDAPKGRKVIDDPDRGDKKLNTKRVYGDPNKAAMRLSKPAFTMVTGEGLETTYSAMQASGHAGWCSYSLDNLVGDALMDAKGERHPLNGRLRLPCVVPDMSRPGMILPPECREQILLGDGDTKDMHMLRAKLERGARRANQAGIVGRVSMSPPGTDFNSFLMGVA